jgi:putative serine protease PepD
MQPIQIVAAGRTWTFDQPRVLTIGRSPDVDIMLASPSISRRHAELRPTETGWELVDLGAENGTWFHDDRITQRTLDGPTVVRFGHPSDGIVARIAPAQPAASTDGPSQAASPDLDATLIHSRAALQAANVDPQVRQGPGLLVRSRAGDKRFTAQSPIRIGREPHLEIVADDPAVSRQHAVLEPRRDGWWYVDRSNSGSYVDGDKIMSRKISEPTEVHLGHPTAGFELELVPIVSTDVAQKGLAKKRRRRRVLVGSSIVAVLALVAGGIAAAVLLTGEDTSSSEAAGLTATELSRAKKASVQIIAIDSKGNPYERGSGSIISDTGLILSNAHVADPDAPGLSPAGKDAAYYLVALPKADDSPAEPTYRAKTIVSDGYLDLAIIQIFATADGKDIDPATLDLPEPLPIGDSKKLQTGDEITALGYPSLSNPSETSNEGPLTITRGLVSSFQADPVTSTQRFFIDSDLRLGSGNSGGASINDAGELIGINSAVVTAETSKGERGSFTSGSSLIRPIEFAADIIKIARDGGDPSYTSPYIDKIPKLDPAVKAKVKVESAGWSREPDKTCKGVSTTKAPQTITGLKKGDTVYAQFKVSGVPNDTSFAIVIAGLDEEETVISRQRGKWADGESELCAPLEVKVPGDVPGVEAVFVIGPQSEITVVNPLLFGS